jgi:hypothetical protein
VHNPEYEDEALNKNVATAITAAPSSPDQPVLGIHILPAWTNTNRTAYLRWIKTCPTYCKHVLQLPKGRFIFTSPHTWEKESTEEGSPRWGVNIIATGNSLGFNTYFPYWNPAYMEHFYQTIQQAINSTLPAHQQINDVRQYIPMSWNSTKDPPSLTTCT